MDLTVTIPPQITEEAEKVAQEMGMSLDELFTQAITLYLSLQAGDFITEELDALYEEDSHIDPALLKAQSKALGIEKW